VESKTLRILMEEREHARRRVQQRRRLPWRGACPNKPRAVRTAMAVRAASRQQARLAHEGQEWLPGRDYQLGAIIGGQDGEGRNSVVFRIQLLDPSGASRQRRGGVQTSDEYALKMVVHLVGERRQDRAGHDRSTQLARHTGAEWREPLQLPPHECLVPVLHHYHSTAPRLRDYVDPMLRDAVADKTLFLVMPLYQQGSLRSFIEARKREDPHPPYGLGWVWFGNLLLRMCRAVRHLIAADKIHGDIKDDNFFIDDDGGVVLGDFGTAWALLDEDGVELRLTSRNDLLEKRAGVGRHKAPEVRGRAEARGAPLLRDVYAKAEGFSVGVVVYGLLDALHVGDVFDRLADTMLDEERRYERGDALSKPDDPFYGRRQPGWVYTTDELPALPDGMPGWLAEVVVGLVKSDDCPEEQRLTPAEAIALLEVQGVAQTWEKLDAARRETQEHALQVQELAMQREAAVQVEAKLQESLEERLTVERALQTDLANAVAAKVVAEAAAAQALAEKQACEREMEERKNRRRQRAEVAEAATKEAKHELVALEAAHKADRATLVRELASLEAARSVEQAKAAQQLGELRSASEAEVAETTRLRVGLAALQETQAALLAAREGAESRTAKLLAWQADKLNPRSDGLAAFLTPLAWQTEPGYEPPATVRSEYVAQYVGMLTDAAVDSSMYVGRAELEPEPEPEPEEINDEMVLEDDESEQRKCHHRWVLVLHIS
jgi:serine/threonine protein kinase